MGCVHGFLHLKLEKHHSYLPLTFLTTVDYIYYLFQGFSGLITLTVPCHFIYGVQKHHCYFRVKTLASTKSTSDTLFVVWLSLDTFFLPFSGIFTCNYMKHTCPVAVYTLNTPSTPSCLFLTAENLLLTFHAVVWPSKHRRYLCFNFQSFNFLICLLANSLFLLFCGILTCNCTNRTYLVAVSPGKT